MGFRINGDVLVEYTEEKGVKKVISPDGGNVFNSERLNTVRISQAL